RDDRRPSVAAAAVPAGVGGDREEPGGDFGAAVVLMGPGDHLDEHLLCHLFRRAPVRKQSVRKPKKGRGVALEELSRPARVPAPDPFQQGPVRRFPDPRAVHDPTGTALGETIVREEGFAARSPPSPGKAPGGSRPYDPRSLNEAPASVLLFGVACASVVR